MRQRLFIIVTLVVVVLVLIALNAASYVKIEQAGDSEGWPDRSTFSSGATGTRALYDFLRESGYQVTRWSESPSSLLSFSGPKPATIVGECNSTSFVVTTPAIMATLLARVAKQGACQSWITRTRHEKGALPGKIPSGTAPFSDTGGDVARRHARLGAPR